MKFEIISKEASVYPGEYLLYEPTMEIVLCGAFNREKDMIRCLSKGQLLEDKIANFKKIRLSKKERNERRKTKCKGCGGR